MAKKKKRRMGVGLQVVTLCISTALVLVLLGIVVLSVFTTRNLSEYVKENLVVTLMLQENVSDNDSRALCTYLKNKPYVAKVTFVSKEQALKEQIKALGTDPSEFIGENPFLASVELQMLSDYANNDSLQWISKELQANKMVNGIEYSRDLVESVNKNMNKINIVLLILAALLTFISFSLINNTVRLDMYSHRFTIHTMKLVGASWAFIRKPILKRALLEGLVAAVIAIVVLAIGLSALYAHEPDVEIVLTQEVLIITGVAMFLFGILITLICAYLSANKFLKMKAGELYNI